MKRVVSVFLLSSVFLFCDSLNLIEATYKVTIDVSSTKSSGKSWDSFGGAPGIMIKINNKLLPLKKECKNSYRCSYNFSSKKSEWYFEVYDKDLKEHDLIGKGKCSANQTCKIGLADLNISKE